MANDININLYDVVAEAEAYFQNIDITKKGSGWKACLLYTSPSPRDQEASRMPSSA